MKDTHPTGLVSAFDKLRLHNAAVSQIMDAGGTAEDCAVSLAAMNDRLVVRVMALESIAPRRIRLPDGRVMVWRCPDSLVPDSDHIGDATVMVPRDVAESLRHYLAQTLSASGLEVDRAEADGMDEEYSALGKALGEE